MQRNHTYLRKNNKIGKKIYSPNKCCLIRSSHRSCPERIGILINFAKFAGKHFFYRTPPADCFWRFKLEGELNQERLNQNEVELNLFEDVFNSFDSYSRKTRTLSYFFRILCQDSFFNFSTENFKLFNCLI